MTITKTVCPVLAADRALLLVGQVFPKRFPMAIFWETNLG